MRKIILSLNVTLDGFCDHTQVIANDESHRYALEQMSAVDALLFGRVTYQLFENYWPGVAAHGTATETGVALARRIDAIPKIVVSTTLKEVGWNTQIIGENIEEEVRKLKQQPGGNLVVLGSLSLALTLINLGLIDEYQFFMQPFVAGKGKVLSEGLRERLSLRLVDTRVFQSGVVVLCYEPK